jgi:septal ring factor EnvC (AmiA/AmiB activator)
MYSPRNKGYYLSFCKDPKVDWSKVGVDELRMTCAKQAADLEELRQYNRALSDALWKIRKYPDKEKGLEETVTQQLIQIDKLQNTNHELAEKNRKLKAHINALKLSTKTTNPQEKKSTSHFNTSSAVLKEVDDAVYSAKSQVAAQLKLLSNSSAEIERIKKTLSRVDQLFEERAKVTEVLKQMESEIQAQQTPADDASAQAEISRLRLAVEGYFFQFSGTSGNGGQELEWLANRAERLQKH